MLKDNEEFVLFAEQTKKEADQKNTEAKGRFMIAMDQFLDNMDSYEISELGIFLNGLNQRSRTIESHCLDFIDRTNKYITVNKGIDREINYKANNLDMRKKKSKKLAHDLKEVSRSIEVLKSCDPVIYKTPWNINIGSIK